MPDFTIPDLGAGGNLSATDLLEVYQGSSPSVKLTGLQVGQGIVDGAPYSIIDLSATGPAYFVGASVAIVSNSGALGLLSSGDLILSAAGNLTMDGITGYDGVVNILTDGNLTFTKGILTGIAP